MCMQDNRLFLKRFTMFVNSPVNIYNNFEYVFLGLVEMHVVTADVLLTLVILVIYMFLFWGEF